ncbi:MAG: AAA family ATPase [Gammaproteobacteria bacterium]|nr:AAA family ATPase [Gammaproteobacteria bacterium]
MTKDKDADSRMYTSFYGFSARPFRLNPDPQIFFHSPVHDRALAYLRYGLEQGEGFVVITGDPGTGKTLLLRALVAEHPQPQLETVEIVTSRLDGDEILRLLAASLKIATHGAPKGELLALLRNYLVTRARQGGRVLVLVDEAHDLSHAAFEELRMLSSLQVGGSTPLQCFLLGHTTLLQRLSLPEMEQFQQRVIATCHLHALSTLETRQYVELRLTHVNWQDNPHFTDAAFELLHHYTGGVPRRINTFCDRLLLYAALEELAVIDALTLQAVIEELTAEMHVPVPSDELRADELAAEHLSARAILDASTHSDLEPELHAAAEPASTPNTPVHPNPQQASGPHAVVPDPLANMFSARPDESAKEDGNDVPTLVEIVETCSPAAPIAADKTLVQLQHAWQARRRMPAWIATVATTAAAAAIFLTLKLTSLPEEHSRSAQLQTMSSATADIPGTLDPNLQQSELLPVLPSTQKSQVLIPFMPPSADIGDDVMASIAPFVSDPIDAVAPETAVSPWADQPPDMPATDLAESSVQNTSTRAATPVTQVARVRSEPARRKATAAAPAEKITAPVVSPNVAERTVPVRNDAIAVNRPAANGKLELPKSAAIAEMPILDASARFPAQEDISTVKVGPLKRAKLAALLASFEAAYQAGNVPQLTALFAPDARTTDAQGRGEILRVYRKLFDVTDRRQIGIDHVAWDIHEGQAHGAAHFVVTVLEKGAHVPRSYTGALSIVVKPDQEGLTISQLYHEYAAR